MAGEQNQSRPAAGFPGGRPGGFGGPRPMAGMMGPKVKAKNARGTLKRLWSYLGRQKKAFILVFTLVVVSSFLNLLGPYLIGEAVDSMGAGLRGTVDFTRLFAIAGKLAAVYVMSAAFTWLQTFIMVRVTQNTVKDLRQDLFEKLQTLSLRFFDSRSHGELMSRLTNDVENINNTLTQSTTQVFASVIMVAGSLIMMLRLSPILALVSLISVPLGFLVTGNIAKHTRKFFGAQQKELGRLNGCIEETITGQRVVKAFSREKMVLEEFKEISDNLKREGMKAQIFSGTIGPLMNVVNNLSFALVSGVGGWLAVQGMVTVGVIASFINYSKQFTRPINELANQFNMIQSAIAGAERVFEVMDEMPDLPDIPEAAELKNARGEVILKDVDFSYKKETPVLKNVSITARPGETIALVGPTGAGKTTIVNLLTRFYDIDGGEIRIDGLDIRKVKKEDLRKSLGIVLQDTYLFSDTVRENIRYGRLDATDAQVEEAARLANADTFIRRLSHGYDTVLTEHGGNISQGQRQLLTIARAILANPSILILDEATSSVDTRTEMHIQEAMLSLMKGRTSFVIAHRLSTIRQADQILVINGGEIIERGSHEELMSSKGFYYNLYTTQLRKQSA